MSASARRRISPRYWPETIFSKRCSPGFGSSSSRSSATSYGVSTAVTPSKFPDSRFRMPAGPRSAARLVPVPRISPTSAGRAAASRPLARKLWSISAATVSLATAATPIRSTPARAERGAEQPRHVLALEALQGPALGRGQRHRPIDPLEAGRVGVDERERRGGHALRPGHAADRPRDQVEDRLRGAALVGLGKGERFLRDDAGRPIRAELDQARRGPWCRPSPPPPPGPARARRAGA